jgi:hypothetical protein
MGDPTARNDTGRRFFWWGLLFGLVGAPLYAVQLTALHRTDTPWYLPILGTIGAAFAILAVRRRKTTWRMIGFVFVAGLAAAQWWFLLSYVRLPTYSGPVAAGKEFPDFAARRADGTTVTGADLWNHAAFFRGNNADLPPDHAMVLVFFRGRW